MCLRHIETSLTPLCLDVSSFSRLMLQNFHYDLIVLYIRFSKITVPLAKPEHSVCLPWTELSPLQDKFGIKKHSASTLMPFSRISSVLERCSKDAFEAKLRAIPKASRAPQASGPHLLHSQHPRQHCSILCQEPCPHRHNDAREILLAGSIWSTAIKNQETYPSSSWPSLT